MGSNALSAAELVAALQGRTGETLQQEVEGDEELQEWIAKHNGKGKRLVPAARRAVAKSKANSELQQLWEESEYYEKWLEVVAELESSLAE
ncbi:DUF4259 domain-containing protein [Paenibacillus sp. NPDC058071]|uniref:DUF4259 domain-containing protein n=1 Tax=Paenibacillus sp. NPDC058071 TaxID=3346326 RepID=UPI0036DD1A87